MLAGITAPDTHWVELERVRLNTWEEVVLRRCAGRYEIRFNGWELMSDRAHWSETALGTLACEAIHSAAPQVLIGGLGIGYTLRAALDALPASARVVVAELLPAVVAWNRGPLGELTGRPLDDPRIILEPSDVARVLAGSAARFDAIMLDVDNGPDDVTVAGNRQLYAAEGLGLIRRALKLGGRLAVWSARRSSSFEAQLTGCSFGWETVEIAARGSAGDPKHTIYLAEPMDRHVQLTVQAWRPQRDCERRADPAR